MLLDLRQPNSLYIDSTEWANALVVFVHRDDTFGGVFAADTKELDPQDEIPGNPEDLLGRAPCSAYLIQPYDQEGLFAELAPWKFLVDTWSEKPGPFIPPSNTRPSWDQQSFNLTVDLHGTVEVRFHNGSETIFQIENYDPNYTPRVEIDEYESPTRYERLVGEDLLVGSSGYEPG